MVPRERLEPVLVSVEPDVPKSPPEDGLGRELAHAGTGCSTGSSTGAGAGTGSSTGVISISRSVSGRPISIADSFLGARGPGRQGLSDVPSFPLFR